MIRAVILSIPTWQLWRSHRHSIATGVLGKRKTTDTADARQPVENAGQMRRMAAAFDVLQQLFDANAVGQMEQLWRQFVNADRNLRWLLQTGTTAWRRWRPLTVRIERFSTCRRRSHIQIVSERIEIVVLRFRGGRIEETRSGTGIRMRM